MSASMNRLSTGLRINTAREDPAGMAIANKLTFQMVGLQRASDNSGHGVSLVQTAEGALNEVHAMLQRMRELAVQAANDTNVEADRMAIQREVNDLTDEVTALSRRSEFNTIGLLNGEAARVSNSWANIAALAADPVLTRVLATPLFVSEAMPAGTLHYTIASPASPAVITGDLFDADEWNNPVGMSGRMLINGIPVDVEAHHTMARVWQEIIRMSEYAGVTPSIEGGIPPVNTVPGDPSAGPMTIQSIRNGTHEMVRLDGSPALWSLFGIEIPLDTLEYDGSPMNADDLGLIIGTSTEFVEVSGVITVNGSRILVTPNMTFASVNRAVTAAAGDSDDVILGGDVYVWEALNFAGDFEPAALAGRVPLERRGTCVRLENVEMRDRLDQPITAFNDSIALSSFGNRVTITSAQGHRIEINIHVPAQYRGGAANDGVDFFDDDGNFAASIEMELRIENFGGLRVQIGPNYNMFMDIQIPRVNAETLGLVEYRAGTMVRLLHYTTWEGAQRAIDQTDNAIQTISRIRSRLGAYQNRLEHTIRNLDNAAVNTEGARSRVQDTDMAREMTLLSKRQVMYQAGLAILGQANQRPQMILQLIQ